VATVKQRERKPANKPPADSTAPGPRKGKGGAPRLNRNAVKHGAFLNERKRTARATRDRHARAAEADAREILRSCGLENDPLAKLIARQVRRLETQAGRFESFLDSRGSFTRGGEVKGAVREFVSVTERLLGEARRLLEQLASMNTGSAASLEEAQRKARALVVAHPDAFTFTMRLTDDTRVFLDPDAPGAPVERSDDPGEAPMPPVETEAARRHQANVDAWERTHGTTRPAAPASPSRPALTPFQRAWIAGDDLP
jgi:plasmid stability protein